MALSRKIAARLEHAGRCFGRGLNLPVMSIPREQAPDHFGFLGHFFGMDIAASSAATRQLLGWNPTHPDLVDDIDAGRYFSAMTVAS